LSMERRKFIIKSTVGGLALGFVPIQLFSKGAENIVLFDFPESSGQIRHGIYSAEIEKHIHVDEFITYLEKNVFYKNGFEKGNEDLINLSFKFKEELHSFSWISNTIHFENEVYYSEVNRLIALSDKTPNITAIQLNGKLNLELREEVIVIPLDGNCHVNKNYIDDQKGLIIQANDLNLESNKEVKLILISRNYK